MSSQFSTAPGAPGSAPVARKWPWAPWLAVAGAGLSLLMLLVPWVTVDGESNDKVVHFNKLAGTGWLRSFATKKLSDGGWAAHAWLTVLVLLAIVVVATMLLHRAGNKALAYALAALAALHVIMLIWGIVAASTLAGSINDLGSNGKDEAGMAAGPWLFLLASLLTLAGVALTLIPILGHLVPTKSPAQGAYGQAQGQWGQQPQPGQWGQPQQPAAPQQGQWGQPQGQQAPWGQQPSPHQQPQAPQQPQPGQWAPQQGPGEHQPPQGR